MARRAFRALGVLPTEAGEVIVRAGHVANRGWYLVLAGPQAALRRVVPSWTPRSARSTRTQLTPSPPFRRKRDLIAWYHRLAPELLHNASQDRDVRLRKPAYGTLAEGVAVVEDEIAGVLRVGTCRTYGHQWRTMLRRIPGETPLAELDQSRLQAVVAQLVKQGYAASTTRNLMVALGRVFKRAVDDGILSTRPDERVLLPRVQDRRVRCLDGRQRDRLLSVAERHGRDIHAFIGLGVLAGLRKAEILALRWRHVDVGRRLIMVMSGDAGFETKSGRSRVVPICDRLEAILRPYREADGERYVVAPRRQGSGRYRWEPRRTFRKVTAEAGVGWISVHGLRHSYATLLARGGVGLWKVGVWLGHRSPGTTSRYAHAAEAWDDDCNRVG